MAVRGQSYQSGKEVTTNPASYNLHMKSAVLLLALALSAHAQSTANPASPDKADNKQVGAKLHLDVVKLVEVSGVRERMQSTLKPLLEEARKAFMNECKRCTAEFGEEWGSSKIS
jgi:hypothetical protein